MLGKSLFLLALAGLFISQITKASESQSRSVIGGDLVFTAAATGATQDEALFRAEAQAVRMITIECSVPHRETKIFHQTVAIVQGRFQAQVSAGLPLSSCEEAQNATPERKKVLTSETLASEQSAYEKLLFGEKVLVKPVQAKAEPTSPLFSQLRKTDYQFTPQFQVSYQQYLSAQTNCRERIRTLIRQGESTQADALMLQCH